jgi:hypothetical protein
MLQVFPFMIAAHRLPEVWFCAKEIDDLPGLRPAINKITSQDLHSCARGVEFKAG